jgi:hypothetical protein
LTTSTAYPCAPTNIEHGQRTTSDQGQRPQEKVDVGNAETLELHGRARMACARRAAGGELNDVDRAALDACPQPASAFFPGESFPVGAPPARAVEPDGVTSVRRRRRITARRTAWVDVATGAGIVDDGRAFTVATSCAADVLDHLPDDVRTVQLVGARPGGDADGFAGWRSSAGEWVEGQHYVESLMFPVLRYERDGRRVDMQRAAGWLGDGGYTIGEARDAMTLAGQLVAARFDGAELWATAATTGRELWRASIPHGREWPVLSSEHRELIRSTSGQGRVELRDVGDELPGLAELDGRLMYGALCWGLATGRPTRGRGEWPGWVPQTRGRFLCRWVVPADWSHVGLLPMKDGERGWRYPSAPGERGEGWVDGAELALARSRGWVVEVVEHLVFATVDGDPLKGWADKLVRAWESAEHAQADERVRTLARAAVRSILLHGIGSFVGRPAKVTRSAPLDRPELIPAGAILPRAEGDRWVWGEHASESPNDDAAHPEWAAAVWARCRVRLLDSPTGARDVRAGALHLPASSVVGMRTDALYLTERPAWPDDGKVGRLRLKAWQQGPLPAPRSHAELVALRDHGRAQ